MTHHGRELEKARVQERRNLTAELQIATLNGVPTTVFLGPRKLVRVLDKLTAIWRPTVDYVASIQFDYPTVDTVLCYGDWN